MSSLTQLVGELRLASTRGRLGGSTSNALYSIADYVSQPLAMILAAPVLLHRLGAPQFGLWMIVTAVVGSLGILGTGFGDATVKYVAEFRGRGDSKGVERVIRSTLTIHSMLGGVFGAAAWLSARFLAHSVFKVDPALLDAATWSLRIGGLLLFVRSIESVFVSTLRAFEDYRATVRVSIATRVVTVLAAVLLTVSGHGVLAIMVASLVIGATGVLLQALAVITVTGGVNLTPSWHGASMSLVFAFGSFSWFQALSAVALMHADRLLVGAYLGTAAVAYYSICVQLAQPIHGISAAALNVIFPNITAKLGRGDVKGSQRVFRRALIVNILFAAVMGIPLVVLSRFVLTHWMGSAFANTATPVLRILAVAYALLAVNVTGHYTLLALGKVRFVTMLNVIAGVTTLGIAVILVGPIGLIGAAIARLAYGPATLLYYWAAHKGILKHVTGKFQKPTGNSGTALAEIVEAQDFV